MKRLSLIIVLLITVLITTACGSPAEVELIPVKFMLDWVPNTNHTGIFVAEAKGYFEDAGLDVDIIQPGEVRPEAAIASGATDFGISFQEQVTLARADDIPVVSIAAVIQHNTSGFASAASLNVTGPADFEGLRYGAWGSPFEEPTLEVLMKCAGADFSKLEIVNTGWSDPLALIDEKQIDMAWIFYGWQGFQAQQQGVALNVVMMEDYFDCIPDYYTPVVIASEETIATRPDVTRAVIKALSRGYEFAVKNPGEAADLLLAAVPELDAELVKASQEWLSGYYQAEAPRWGEQKESVWKDYSDWMVEYGILSAPISASDAFTNEFLP
ncbi:MAG TPA: ABC transporter substrate-binding protein [Dehalococcoidia bacterium]|nr:ABC transporter substrate-binding protein [Dehalococcoidia bacterium]